MKEYFIVASFFISITALASELVSGFISVSSDDKKCVVEWGANSDKVTCDLKYSEDRKTPYIQVSLTKLNLKTPPICVFDGQAEIGTNKKIQLLMTRFSTNEIDLMLPSLRRGKVRDAIATFICTTH
jgi:hypothetical protein